MFFLRVIKKFYCAKKSKISNLTLVNMIILNKPCEKNYFASQFVLSWLTLQKAKLSLL
jgi:hypothetical protein